MANNIYLKTYEFTGDERIIFDTNILMYLFSTFYSENDYNYGEIFGKMLENKVKLYITDHIVSEFINTNCRVAFKQYRESFRSKQDMEFKRDYRNTEDFKLYFQLAKQIVKDEMFPYFEVLYVEKQEAVTSLEKTIAEDYTDELMVHTALKHNCGILTHDYDFQTIDLPINIFHMNNK